MRISGQIALAVILLLALQGCGGMMGMGGEPAQPEMNLSGTLTRAQTSSGVPGDYYLSGAMGSTYLLANVPAGSEPLIGKQVAVTGKMDTSSGGAGGMKILVSKIQVLEGAP